MVDCWLLYQAFQVKWRRVTPKSPDSAKFLEILRFDWLMIEDQFPYNPIKRE